METSRIVFASLFAVAACGASANDKIQVWVDDRGQTHYGNAAPGGTPQRTLDVPLMPAAEERETAKQRAAQEKERLAQWEASRPVVDERVNGSRDAERVPCARAVQIVDFLREYHELIVVRPLSTGEIAWMSEEEREAHLIAAMDFLRERCATAPDASLHDLWVGLFWPRTVRAPTPRRSLANPGTPFVEPIVGVEGFPVKFHPLPARPIGLKSPDPTKEPSPAGLAKSIGVRGVQAEGPNTNPVGVR